jgi:hypothetical protein
MKRIHFFLAAVIIAFSGCSTYKQTQTPDDVYYSPGAVQPEYASSSNNNNQGEYYSVANDQYVKMRVQDPQRWSYFDDYNTDYYGGYSPVGYNASFGYGYGGMGYGGMGFGISPWIGFGYWSPISYWNSYYSWNGFYNPYYGGIIVTNPKVQNVGYSRVSTFNPSSYTNNSYNRGNTRPGTSAYTPYSYSQTIRSNYNNTNSSFRNYNSRQAFSNPNRNNSNQPSRTYSAPTRSSSSFGGGSSGGGSRSGGGGGGGVSRPGR